MYQPHVWCVLVACWLTSANLVCSAWIWNRGSTGNGLPLSSSYAYLRQTGKRQQQQQTLPLADPEEVRKLHDILLTNISENPKTQHPYKNFALLLRAGRSAGLQAENYFTPPAQSHMQAGSLIAIGNDAFLSSPGNKEPMPNHSSPVAVSTSPIISKGHDDVHSHSADSKGKPLQTL